MAASPAPTMLPDPVALWRHHLDAMPADRSPCRYLTPAAWAEIRGSAIDFLDRFGLEAVRLGWTARELFAVHAQHGTLRPDACGVLMINGRRATGIEANRVLLGNLSGYRDKPGQVWGPPVWEFAGRSA